MSAKFSFLSNTPVRSSTACIPTHLSFLVLLITYAMLFLPLVSALEYQIALRGSEGSVSDFGTVTLQRDGIFNFALSNNLNVYPDGCLGVVNNNEFKCHSLYSLTDSQQRALLAFIGPNGELSHFQFTEGEFGDFLVDVPKVAPKVAVKKLEKKKVVKKQKDKAKELWDKKRNRKQEIDEEDEDFEEEPSFFRKYWLFIVPAGLMIFSNILKYNLEQKKKQKDE